jgi:hypothetical protein
MKKVRSENSFSRNIHFSLFTHSLMTAISKDVLLNPNLVEIVGHKISVVIKEDYSFIGNVPP